MSRASILLTSMLMLWVSIAGATVRHIAVIPLHHRTAEEIIPLLQPVAGKVVGLSGEGHKLIVRGTVQQIDDIKAVVSKLDHQAARVLITVRNSRESPVTLLGSTGEPLSPNATPGVELRTDSTDARNPNRLDHTVEALEGHPAFISARVDIPIRQHAEIWTGRGAAYRDETRYLAIDRGFYAVAWIDGDSVTVKIAVDRDRFKGPSAPVQRRRVVTTVSGKLGEWILIGGVTTPVVISGGPAVVYRTENDQGQRGTLWLKVNKGP